MQNMQQKKEKGKNAKIQNVKKYEEIKMQKMFKKAK